jgi:hypothetical protein
LVHFLGFLESFLDSGVLIPGLALCFGFYIAYLLLSARNVVPMTRKEAETLWKFHKQKSCCQAEQWYEIAKKNKLIGFECDCGFKQIQKKHLITVG